MTELGFHLNDSMCWVCAAGQGLQGGSCQKLLEASLAPNLHPALAKAKPISNGSCASVIASLRRGKRLLKNLQGREEWDVRAAAMQTPRSVKKAREEVPRS